MSIDNLLMSKAKANSIDCAVLSTAGQEPLALILVPLRKGRAPAVITNVSDGIHWRGADGVTEHLQIDPDCADMNILRKDLAADGIIVREFNESDESAHGNWLAVRER